jgi:hypothetical protein
MTSKADTSPEFDRFNALVTRVLSVPRAEIQKRMEDYKRQSASNPNKRGPKPRSDKTT